MASSKPVIALIEDEPLVRVPLARALEDAGFTVLSAASGAEGLELLGDRHIHLAIVDLILPGRIGGIGMLREARRYNPSLKAILVSGKDPAEDVSDLGPFLAKPLRMDVLTALARKLIDAGRTGLRPA